MKKTAKTKTRAKFKSDAFEAIHSSASALARVGAIDKTTMRSFDASCLVTPPGIKPHEIKRLRERFHVSQPVFAALLNVPLATERSWEQGKRKPSGAALRLLDLARQQPKILLAA